MLGWGQIVLNHHVVLVFRNNTALGNSSGNGCRNGWETETDLACKRVWIQLSPIRWYRVLVSMLRAFNGLVRQ